MESSATRSAAQADETDGERRFERIILDDIAHAADHGNALRVEQLPLVLQHFIATHPDLD